MDTSLHVRLSSEYEPVQIDQLLAGKFAFEAESPITATWTFYDTFDGVLQSAIPYLSHFEQMGVYRQLVQAFAPTSPASVVYKDLWEEIYQELLDERK